MEAVKNRLFELVAQVVDRAQQSGQLRADLTLEDLALVTWANSRILQAGRAAGVPDVWRRHLGLLLDGFRADRAHPLPQPPLSPRQVHRAMLTLGRRSAGDTHEHPATASSSPATTPTTQRSRTSPKNEGSRDRDP